MRGPTEVDARLIELLGGLAVTMVEMEQGLRPVTALDGFASPAARRRIRAVLLWNAERRRGERRRTVPASVVRTAAAHPSASALEGAVILREDDRIRAFAIRLERGARGWRIVELAPPEAGLAPAGMMP